MEVACGPCAGPAFTGSDLSELSALLQPSVARTPTVTYLGVSPPVRSGAANPWAHDRSWTRSAYSASHTNLEALRELDSTGESFLLAGARHAPGRLGGSGGAAAAAACTAAVAAGSCGRGGGVDAASLVLASPDAGVLVAEAAAADDAEAAAAAIAAAGEQEDAARLSDAESESAVAAVAAPGAPLCAPSRPRPAPLLRVSLPPTGAACAPPAACGAAAALQRASAPASGLAARMLGGAPPPPRAQRCTAAGGGAGKQPALEPFTCLTQYYV